MSTLMFLYNTLLFFALPFALPYYAFKSLSTGKYRRNLAARLGRVHVPALPPGKKRLWIHAVSVGEVTAAAAVVRALSEFAPEVQVIVSTTTETGQEMARRVLPEAEGFIYFPLDLPGVVDRVLNSVRPDLIALTETELWPNFLAACRRRSVPVVLVNGRLSDKSFRRYRASRWFWGKCLAGLQAAGMISFADANRVRALGMPKERVFVYGNAKYDALAARVSPHLAEEAGKFLGLRPEEPIFVAGSTHEGEEEIVLSVYGRLLRAFPLLTLILIPRHPERGAEVVRLCRRYGLSDTITYREIMGGRERNKERVVIVDVIGELFKLYGLAAVVFCGGSLVPRGGQNILEAAAWGKAPLFGPYMGDFRAERDLLVEGQGGIEVKGEDELYERLLFLLKEPTERREWGKRAQALVAQNRGAARRYAELIVSSLRERSA